MNIIKILLSSLLGSGIAFFTQIYLANKLEHADYGIYSTLMSYSLVAVPILTFGFEQYLYKYYANTGSAVHYLRCFFCVTFFTLISLIFAVFFECLTIEIACFFISQAWLLILLSLYQCDKNYTAFSVVSSIIPFFRFIFLYVFIYINEATMEVVLNSLFWSSFIIAIYCVISSLHVAMKLDSKRFQSGIFLHKNVNLRDSVRYAFSSISFAIYFQGSIIFIAKLLSYRDVAYFSAAYLIVTTSYLLPTIFYQKYIIPILHHKMNDVSSCKNIYIGLNFFSLLIGIFIAFLILILSDFIIEFFFNDSFKSSITILKFLSVAVFVKYVSSPAAAFMMTNDNIKAKNKMMVFSAILNIVLCLFMIKLFGLWGAVVAVIISELVIGISYIIYCSRYVFNIPIFRSFNYNPKWEWRELR